MSSRGPFYRGARVNGATTRGLLFGIISLLLLVFFVGSYSMLRGTFEDPDSPTAVRQIRQDMAARGVASLRHDSVKEVPSAVGVVRRHFIGDTDDDLTRLANTFAARPWNGNARIIVAESNTGFSSLTDNWIAHARRSLRLHRQPLQQQPEKAEKSDGGSNEAFRKALSVDNPVAAPSSSAEEFTLPYLTVALDDAEFARLSLSAQGDDDHAEVITGGAVWYNATHGPLASEAQSFFDESYRSLVNHKWTIVASLLERKVDVLLSDVDALLLRDPFAYIDTLPECDAYFATESFNIFPSSRTSTGAAAAGSDGGSIRRGANAGTAGNDDEAYFPEGEPPRWSDWIASFFSSGNGKGQRQKARNYVNSGFVYFRSNDRTHAFVKQVTDVLGGSLALEFDGDQSVVNQILDDMRISALEKRGPAGVDVVPPTLLRPSCARYGDFTFHVFTPFLFQNGKHTRHLRLTEVIHEAPFMRHYNFLADGKAQKIAMMKHEGTWIV